MDSWPEILRSLRPAPMPALVSLVVMVAPLVGCDDPYVVRTMEHDRQSMRFALDSYAAREARWAANLEDMAAIVAEQWQDDVATLPKSLAGTEAYFQEDLEDWPRHEADIREEIRRQFQGDPATIRRTLPRLAF